MMTNPSGNTDAFSNTAVLLAAHGSTKRLSHKGTTQRQAKNLGEMNIFAEVKTGLLAVKPYISDVLETFESSEIYIVPNMTTNGYVCTSKLPITLGLTGYVTERIAPKGHQRLILTDPVGTHPLMAKIMAKAIQKTLEVLGVDLNELSICVIGHGSTNSPASFNQTAKIAADLAQFEFPQLGQQHAITTAFLEETPYVQDWCEHGTPKTILFAPFLISDGFHATHDIPLAIGFTPNDPAFQDTLAMGLPCEMVKNKQRMIYMPPIGSAPEIVEIILARIKQAHEKLVS